MTDREIIERAHRMAWRYKHHEHRDGCMYTFNATCMIDFARWVEAKAAQSQQATLERRTELLRECLAELDPFSQKLTIARIDAELGDE